MLILSSEDKPRSPNKCYKKKHLFARLTGVQNSLISRLRRRWKHLKSGFAFWETFQWRIQGAWPPLIFRPNWRKKWKNFLDTASPPPRSRYLEVWIRHCFWTIIPSRWLCRQSISHSLFQFVALGVKARTRSIHIWFNLVFALRSE